MLGLKLNHVSKCGPWRIVWEWSYESINNLIHWDNVTTTKQKQNKAMCILYGIYYTPQDEAFNRAWIGNYTHYKVWYDITYPFPNWDV